MNRELSILILGIAIGCLGGILLGMVIQQMIFKISVVEIARGLEGVNIEINVDFNETLIVDRAMDKMNEFGVFNLTNQSGVKPV